MLPPFDPMAPITDDRIPEGAGWGYQLKWDGVRLIAAVDDGHVRLYSRKMIPKDAAYPEIAKLLSGVKGRMVLDGELVWFDAEKQRPVFQKVLQRERSGRPGAGSDSLVYALFDIVHHGADDLRAAPYRHRHETLQSLFPKPTDRLLVADLFMDGALLWRWVETAGWEGIVSKRLDSPYREGKKHRDWLKKKIALVTDADIVGCIWREGRLASLVLSQHGAYAGRVSLGLDEPLKARLAALTVADDASPEQAGLPFPLPAELRGERIRMLRLPVRCTVTGLEYTEGGALRHPKLVKLMWPV